MLRNCRAVISTFSSMVTAFGLLALSASLDSASISYQLVCWYWYMSYTYCGTRQLICQHLRFACFSIAQAAEPYSAAAGPHRWEMTANLCIEAPTLWWLLAFLALPFEWFRVFPSHSMVGTTSWTSTSDWCSLFLLLLFGPVHRFHQWLLFPKLTEKLRKLVIR